MQYQETRYQIAGANALKMDAASNQARIIEFPAAAAPVRQNSHTQRRSRLVAAALSATKQRVVSAVQECDEAFNITSGTCKGVGPRFATRFETGITLGLCAIGTMIAIML